MNFYLIINIMFEKKGILPLPVKVCKIYANARHLEPLNKLFIGPHLRWQGTSNLQSHSKDQPINI